jgi:hypothetical protein
MLKSSQWIVFMDKLAPARGAGGKAHPEAIF